MHTQKKTQYHVYWLERGLRQRVVLVVSSS